MVKHTTAVVATAIVGVMALNAKSHVDVQNDSLIASTKIVSVDGGSVKVESPQSSDVQSKIRTFIYDQFRNTQDPGAPYFMFMSKDGGLLMGIGGTVDLNVNYNWGGAVPSADFIPYYIPIPEDPTDKNRLNATPSGSNLFFRLIGENHLFGTYQAYIEADFDGYNGRDFRLKKAYVMFRDFTFGYTKSTFCDPAAVAPIVDSGGPNNKVDHTAMLIRYMPRISKNILVAASLENPSTDIAADGVSTKACSSYIPDIAGFVQYDWGYMHSQHIRLSAIYRSLPYRDLLTSKNFNKAGWGVQLSSVSHPIDPLTVYLTANYGKGYAGLGGDLSNGEYDLVGNPVEPGRMYVPKSFGWSVGLQYNFTPSLYMGLMGSQARYLPSMAVDPSEYKYGLMGALSLVWNPVPRVEIGAELDLGKRMNFSGEHRYGRRAVVSAQLSF